VQALDVGPAGHALGYLLPVLGAVLFDCLSECVVLQTREKFGYAGKRRRETGKTNIWRHRCEISEIRGVDTKNFGPLRPTTTKPNVMKGTKVSLTKAREGQLNSYRGHGGRGKQGPASGRTSCFVQRPFDLRTTCRFSVLTPAAWPAHCTSSSSPESCEASSRCAAADEAAADGEELAAPPMKGRGSPASWWCLGLAPLLCWCWCAPAGAPPLMAPWCTICADLPPRGTVPASSTIISGERGEDVPALVRCAAWDEGA
jgi:hypothetical protein